MVTRRDTSPEQESEPRGSQPSLIGLIREDWVTHGRAWGSSGFHTLVIYRFGRWQMGLPTTLRTLTNLIYKFLSVMARNIYGIELPLKAQVGRRFRIAHQSGIVIFHNAVIGDDCVIRQNVTIGVGKRGGKAPILGNGVEVGAGAALVGGIAVGDGARIGPNALVMTDVPPGASVFAQPAQTLRLGRNDHTGTPEDGKPSDVVEFVGLLISELGVDGPIAEDTPLITSGVIDSFDVVTLLAIIESQYRVTLTPEELDQETFDTPAQMLAHIQAAK